MLTQPFIDEAKPLGKTSQAAGRSMSRRYLLIVAITAALSGSLWLRVVGINHLPGLNADEAWSGIQALHFLRGEPFAWRTPTGNPINLFFIGPLVVLHAMFPPSIGLLRSVSAASGILAIVANYWFCRRIFDQSTAVVSTVILAVLPINIAYSRFAWDSSQTLLATTFVVYGALAVTCAARRFSLIWITIALAAAVWVHPTNLFLLPLVIVCSWQGLTLQVRGGFFHRLCRICWLPTAIVGGIILGWFAAPKLPAIVTHLASLADAWRFMLDWERLLSGSTVYRFISGGLISDRFDFVDLAFACLLVAAAVSVVQRVKTERNSLDWCLGVGFGLSLLSFYLVAGPQGVEPHFERYATWTIMPATLLIARGVSWRLQASESARRWTMTVTCAAVLALLLSFYDRYLRVLETTGGDSHLAFRTAECDPKQLAFERVRAQSKPNVPTWIISGNWWTRLPLEYFSLGSDDVRVVKNVRNTENLDARQTASNVWLVELAGSSEAVALEQLLQSHQNAFERTVETDHAGRPVVILFRLSEKTAESLKNSSSL